MTKNIDTRKIRLIEKITSIQSIEDIENIDKYVKLLKLKKENQNIFKVTQKTIDVESMKKAQGFTTTDRSKVNKIAKELNIEESIEQLLETLNK